MADASTDTTKNPSLSNFAQAVLKYRRGVLLVLCLVSVFAVKTDIAKASDAAEAASIAVDIFVESGKLVGLPISNEEKALVKEIVKCGVDGANIGDCAKNAAIATVLKAANLDSDMSGLVTCFTGGKTPAATCAADTLADQLPPETRSLVKGLADCVDTPNFMGCARDKIASNVGAQISQLQRDELDKALETLDHLRPDAPLTDSASREKYATLQNILKVAEGIKDGNLLTVAEGAGPELAILACNYIMAMFLGPELASYLAPAVAAAVHNEVAAFRTAIGQFLGNKDPIGAAETMFSWYYTQGINNACALLPDGAAKDTVCGGINAAVQFVAGAVGDVEKAILGAGKDVLDFIGVWKPIDGVFSGLAKIVSGFVDAVGDLFSGGSDWEPQPACGAAIMFPEIADPELLQQKYFVNHYLACASKAADLTFSTFGQADVSAMNKACTDNFNKCVRPEDRGRSGMDKMCATMGKNLLEMGEKSAGAQRSAANAYATRFNPNDMAEVGFREALKNEFFAEGDDFCNPKQWQVLESKAAGKCSQFVGKVFPAMKAGGGMIACPLPTVNSGAGAACSAAVKARFAASPSIVGPNSEYCKKQIEWSKEHACDVTVKGSKSSQDGNYKFDDLFINCNTKAQQASPGLNIEAPDLKAPPPGLILGAPDLNSPVFSVPDLKAPPGLKLGVPDPRFRPVNRLGVKPSDSRGSSGSNTTVRQRAPDKKQSNTKAVVSRQPPASAGSSGFNTSKSNSAMDRLGGLGSSNAITNVTGNSSGLANPGPRAPANSKGSSGTNASRQPPSGGSSGSNTSRPSAGSSGINTSRQPAQAAPARNSFPDANTSYGGCSNCGRDKFQQPR